MRVVLKLFEKKPPNDGKIPPLARAVETDHDMRTKWVEVMRNEKMSVTCAVKHSRIEWVSLFTHLHENKVSKGSSLPETSPTCEPPPKSR